MNVLTIRIQSKADADAGMPAIEGVNNVDQVVQHPKVTVAILEGGMESGKTSLMIALQGNGDKVQIAEISAAAFEGLIGAFRGAQQRFGQATTA